MLTEEQKKELERMFNLYSLTKEFYSMFRTEYSNKMTAFQSAVYILGYVFVPNKMEEKNGVEYASYRLEEIGELENEN